MIQDVVDLGKASAWGAAAVLGVGNGCMGVGSVVTGAGEVLFCVGCKFGLDAAG